MNRYTVAALLSLVFIASVFARASTLSAMAGERSIRVAVVYTPGQSADEAQIRSAYAETLLENGIPFDWLASTDISLFDGEQLGESYSAVVFPDGINRRVSEDAVAELTAFVKLGGSVAVIGDAGSRTPDGTYRPGSLFTEISGVDSLLYRSLRGNAFGNGFMRFSNAASETRWNVPAGKTSDGNLSSYRSGPLEYPYAKAEIVDGKVRVDAHNGDTPLLTVRNVERGRVAYIAMQLGYLRTHSDAFPMTMLISFLTGNAKMPHLVAAPDGIGRLVVDLHIESSKEYLGIPNLLRSRILRRSVPLEFDVTAGPDLDRSGDKMGFNACGRGKPFLQTIMQYGRIGSRGGWVRDEFSADGEADPQDKARMRMLIERNDQCLESITHQAVLSFSAPGSEHTHPAMTHTLDELGMLGYYYTGDTGSPVERPFYNGAIVSTKSWAFPIMPLGNVATVAEMRRAGVSPAAVEAWMSTTADYAAEQRGIYLFYSHSYDLLYPGYSAAMAGFMDHAEMLAHQGRLRTTNMVDSAEFMNRFIITRSAFDRTSAGLHVKLRNDRGLRSIAFAVPTAWIQPRALPAGVRSTGTQRGYTILSVTGNV